MLVGSGEVESCQKPGNAPALNVAVERPARNRRTRRKCEGYTAELVLQFTGSGKNRVAKALDIETPPIHAPDRLILGVLLPGLGIVCAALLVSCRQHNCAMQLL